MGDSDSAARPKTPGTVILHPGLPPESPELAQRTLLMLGLPQLVTQSVRKIVPDCPLSSQDFSKDRVRSTPEEGQSHYVIEINLISLGITDEDLQGRIEDQVNGDLDWYFEATNQCLEEPMTFVARVAFSANQIKPSRRTLVSADVR